MKIRICAALLIALLAVSLLAGCSVGSTLRTLDAAEEAVEYHLDAAEEAVEAAVLPPVPPAPTVPPETAETRITQEEALAIALAHAGFTAEQVKYLHTEFEVDDRIPQYDVNFHEGHWEYEYEIHAETGAILSYERDT